MTLVLQISDGAGGTWDATVVVAQSATTPNTSVNDLLLDIENALTIAQVLDEGVPTGTYASAYIAVGTRSDRLVLSSTGAFTIDGDTTIGADRLGLAGVGPGSDVAAVQPPAVEELAPLRLRRGGADPAAGEPGSDWRCLPRPADRRSAVPGGLRAIRAESTRS